MPKQGGLSRRATLALAASVSLGGCNFDGSTGQPSPGPTTRSHSQPGTDHVRSGTAGTSTGYSTGGFGAGEFGGSDAE